MSAVLLLLSLVFMAQVIRWQRQQVERAPRRQRAGGAGAPERGVGGGVFAAFAQVARSPYLLGIARVRAAHDLGVDLPVPGAAAFVAKVFHSTDERTRSSRGIDFWVQAASLLHAGAAVRRLFKWFGMRALLVSVPLIMIAGYALFRAGADFAVLVGGVLGAPRRLTTGSRARAATRCSPW